MGYQPADIPPPQSPPQGVSGIIPYGQAFGEGDVQRREFFASIEAIQRWVRHGEKADYSEMLFAPADWQKKEV